MIQAADLHARVQPLQSQASVLSMKNMTELQTFRKETGTLAGFKEALRPISVERPSPHSGTTSGQFGWDLRAVSPFFGM